MKKKNHYSSHSKFIKIYSAAKPQQRVQQRTQSSPKMGKFYTSTPTHRSFCLRRLLLNSFELYLKDSLIEIRNFLDLKFNYTILVVRHRTVVIQIKRNQFQVIESNPTAHGTKSLSEPLVLG
jgi:hypothetical protein